MGFKATGAARRPRGAGAGSRGTGADGGQPAGRRSAASSKAAAGRPPRRSSGPVERAKAGPAEVRSPFASPGPHADWQAAVRATVDALHYELVEVERAARGLLRVTIDRRPGQTYAAPGDAVTVDDCELVTRQLQYALSVDGVDYARLEVSSPGLDRPLRTSADYERFAGQTVSLTLKAPFQGRKHYQGLLEHGGSPGTDGWQLTFDEGKARQVLAFTLDEVREARLVPVLDFKGRARTAPRPPASPQASDDAGAAGAGSPMAEDTASGEEAATTRENEEGRNR